MRLSFWNRLALVVGVIGIFAFPSWWVLSHNAEHSRVMESGFETCVANGNARNDAGAYEFCWEVWREDSTGYLGWDVWRSTVFATAIAALIAYALIFVIVAVIKWIWRGREKPPQ